MQISDGEAIGDDGRKDDTDDDAEDVDADINDDAADEGLYAGYEDEIARHSETIKTVRDRVESSIHAYIL